MFRVIHTMQVDFQEMHYTKINKNHFLDDNDKK